MARAANMQALTNDVKREFPGVVVYGIGDTAHKARASGHNEDDTKGSKPELEDSDSRPEHRAIDIMVRGPFSKADADALVARLVADPKARARLFYIIWNGYQWSRSSGWVKRKYTGSDQHTDHVHASGWATDDENTATWPAVAKEDDDMTPEERTWLEKTAKMADQFLNPSLGMSVGGTDTPLHQVLRHMAWPLINGPKGSGAFVGGWMTTMAGQAGISPAELQQISDAAREGAAAAADELVGAVMSKLPAGQVIGREDIEQAVRDAFSGGLAPDQG